MPWRLDSVRETTYDFYTNKPNKNGMFAIHRPCGCSLFGLFESNERRGVVWENRMFGLFGLFVSNTRRLLGGIRF